MSHRPLLAIFAASALIAGATTGALANDPELPESEPTGVEEPAELHIIEDAVMFDDVDDDGSTDADDTSDDTTAESTQQTLLEDVSGDTETQDHPDNHGQVVSEFAHETELEGRERGQAIAAVARTHGESQPTGDADEEDEAAKLEQQPAAEDEEDDGDIDDGDETDDEDTLDDETDDETDDADDTQDTDDQQ